MKSTYRIVACLLFVACCTGGILAQEKAPEEKAVVARVAEAVKQLGAREFADREAAQEVLLEIGAPAVEALREAVGGRDPEVSIRAREVLQLILLGVTVDTPENQRKLAAGLLVEEAPGVRKIALQKLASGGATGLRILQHMQWCAGLNPAASEDAVLALVGGEPVEAVWEGSTKALLDAASVFCGLGGWHPVVASATRSIPDQQSDRILGTRSYISLCLLADHVEKALAQAQEWYGLVPRPETAALIARLHWAAQRPDDARTWARKALQGNDPVADAIPLRLLVSSGDLNAVADYCEASLKQRPDGDASSVAMRLMGGAALCTHLMGETDRRDAHLAALEAATVKRYGDDWDDAGDRFPCYDAYEILVLCGMPDRAVDLAVRNEDYLQAWGIRSLQAKAPDQNMENAARKAASRGIPPNNVDPDLALWSAQYNRENGRLAEGREKLVRLAGQITGAMDTGAVGRIFAALVSMGVDETAQEVEKQLLNPDSAHFCPAAVVAGRGVNGALGGAWYELLATTKPDMSVAERIELAMALADGKLEQQKLQSVIEETRKALADPGIKPEDPSERSFLYCDPTEVLALTYVLNGSKIRAAESFLLTGSAAFDPDGRVAPVNADRAAWLFAGVGDWAKAADALAGVDQEDREFSQVYLWGWALSNMGREEEGRALLDRARRVAYTIGEDIVPDVLCTHGWDEGMRQWQMARLADPYDDAMSVYAPMITELGGDYATTYEQRRNYVLCSVLIDSGIDRSGRSDVLLRSAGYLCYGKDLARRAAGEQVDLEELTNRFLAATPMELDSAAFFVRGLDEFGRRDLADKVYEVVAEDIQAKLRKDPEGSLPQNNCAWFAGLCGRDLDRALTWALAARKAGSHWYPLYDTIAQVHYARGELKEAVENESLAVFLLSREAPFGEGEFSRFYAAQLARFKKALAEAEKQDDGAE